MSGSRSGNRVSRETLICFDAVGTLLRSEPDVAVTYQAVGEQFGVRLSLETIRRRFRTALARETSVVETSEEIERLKWRRIVSDTMPECSAPDDLFNALWNRFASPSQWRLFDDVEPCLEQLEADGFTFAIASNFDQRLEPLCQGMSALSNARYVFHSAGLGFAKPSGGFYAEVERRAETHQRFLMVGDDRDNDFLAAKAAGWSAVHLNRGGNYLTNDQVASLRDLPLWLNGPDAG